MKIYDLIVAVGVILGMTTFPMTGDVIRGLITGGITGVYIGWRLAKK